MVPKLLYTTPAKVEDNRVQKNKLFFLGKLMAYKKGLGSLLACIAPNFFKLAIRKQHVVHYTAMMKMRMIVLERSHISSNLSLILYSISAFYFVEVL